MVTTMSVYRNNEIMFWNL